MRFSSLASGSKGNSSVIEADDFRVLIDCGIPYKELSRRLEKIELSPDSIDALLITHFHSDHISGLETLFQRHDIEIFAPAGFQWLPLHLDWFQLDVKETLELGPFSVQAIQLPHDDGGSLGFHIGYNTQNLVFATDFGTPTPQLQEALSIADFAMIESNHDLEMLATCSYPDFLKRRIKSQHGHLSNCQCRDMLSKALNKKCQQVMLAHLSENANEATLAKKTVQEGTSIEISIAGQYEVSGWREIVKQGNDIQSSENILDAL